VDWGLNVRKLRGQTIRARLAIIGAALRYHPEYRDLDLSWLKPFLNEIPTDSWSEMRERQIAKQIPYEVVEAIPAKLHAERRAAERRGKVNVARHVRNELLIKWLVTLAWRQRNIRQCRIGGPHPNVFKGQIDPSDRMAKFDWVERELRQNPSAEFWQFRFSAPETKIGKRVRGLIPSSLISLLQEYVAEYRPYLVEDSDCDLLFPNDAASTMFMNGIDYLVGELTLRYGGKPLSTHIFRHILAYAWLKDHPDDYLTLSKILWHTDIKTTLNTYGAGYDESNGVCGMETWVDSRGKSERNSPNRN
jgi:integrase